MHTLMFNGQKWCPDLEVFVVYYNTLLNKFGMQVTSLCLECKLNLGFKRISALAKITQHKHNTYGVKAYKWLQNLTVMDQLGIDIIQLATVAIEIISSGLFIY